jgi:hypothetical protein
MTEVLTMVASVLAAQVTGLAALALRLRWQAVRDERRQNTLNTLTVVTDAGDLDKARYIANMLIETLVSARDSAHALARFRAFSRSGDPALVRALADETLFDNALISAVDRLVEAVTDVTGDDLTQVDLRGVPLEGLRWSDRTRWPIEWKEQIRAGSIEISPGLYEIRDSGINIETPT